MPTLNVRLQIYMNKKTHKIYQNDIFLFLSEVSEASYMYGGPFLASICLIKVSNENTKTGCEICSKLTIKTV